MKHLLLASAAAISLAVAMPAFGQVTEPPPPPIVQPALDPDATTEERAAAQAPVVESAPETQTQAEASAAAEPPTVANQTSVAGEAQTAQTEPGAQPIPPTAADAQTPTPDMATQSPAPTAVAETAPADEAAEAAAAGGATPAFASATAVCQPRTTSVHFGQSRSALNQENRNAIEYAVDSASVCDLQQVTIVDSADGSVSSRRASTVRAALVRQGVPEDRITIADENNAGASTGQLDVQMTFAGVAGGAAQMASNEPMSAPVAPETMPAAPTPEATPPTPEVMPVTPTPEAQPQPQEEEQPNG